MMRLTFLIILFIPLFLKSQKDTLIKFYNYKNILIFEGRQIDGKKEGEWKFYNDSLGYLQKVRNFKNDYPDGEFKEFNSSGIMILKGNYSLYAIKKIKTKNKELGGYMYSYKPLPVGELLYYEEITGKLVVREFYSQKGKLLRREKIK